MKIKLIQTCSACPEQYDAFLGENKVGYLRARHGYFTVQLNSSSGEIIYETDIDGDGMFTESERDYQLMMAITAITHHLNLIGRR